jgi:hypothetical protein
MIPKSDLRETRVVSHNLSFEARAEGGLIFAPPKGLQPSAQGFNPGNRPSRATRPHKALPSSVLLEKHPVRRVGGAEGAAESGLAIINT